MSNRYVVLSGCSGGGKSTLLTELRRRGHAVVDEPGRRVVEAELENGGRALPWIDLAAFARQAIGTSIADHETAGAWPNLVFCDRGLVDAAAALEHATGEPVLEQLGRQYRYNETVFLTPRPEIYATDAGRRHGFEDAIAEYERLERAYLMLDYRVVVLPKGTVEARADALLAAPTQHGRRVYLGRSRPCA
ncbi:AAA family ATPase [Caulobacter sp. FWC2]|uniref:AAA family ATPase n=1 Tax=Caulobacter sp. FWC2 TaxID=69664 RepID=UPI000C15EB04|nr:AAA family ATPase [Caulobacter sp. FWC2]PIB92312.1 ATPase [Caulobacter sp. FWC2]